MITGLTVTKRDDGEGHIVVTRSDGELFHLIWNHDGHASVFHQDNVPSDGIDLDVSIPDKLVQAEKLILAYPTGWP